MTKLLAKSPDPGAIYQQWQEEYGAVYTIPTAFGKSCVVLCDPKAIQHFYARETYGYVHTPLVRAFTESLVILQFLVWSVTRSRLLRRTFCATGRGRYFLG